MENPNSSLSPSPSPSSPWSDLPPELLSRILSGLPIRDRLRCRAVSRAWNSGEAQSIPRRQLPWLKLYPSSPATTDIHPFFSLTDNAIHNLSLPKEARGSHCFGSFDDWLVLGDGTDEFLLNPFSKHIIPLPCGYLAASSFQVNYISDQWVREPDLIYKVILSSSPDSSENCLVVFLYDSYYLALCRPGAESMTCHLIDEISDVIFYQGKIYGIDNGCKIYVYDLSEDSGRPFICSVEKPEIEELMETSIGWDFARTYLVESCVNSELLMVVRYGMSEQGLLTHTFKVYELDHGSSPLKWVEKKGLDDQLIFVGDSCSRSFLASQYVGLEGDCIYFSDDNYLFCGGEHWIFKDMGVFSMRNGSIVRFNIPECDAYPPTWFFLSNEW